MKEKKIIQKEEQDVKVQFNSKNHLSDQVTTPSS